MAFANKWLVSISLGLVSCASMGNLVSSDLATLGDGLVTTDTASKLQWLDVSATVGLTVPAVLASQFVAARGFRFATESEVTTLWRDAGAAGPFQYDPSVESYPANYDGALLLVSLLGCTSNVLGDACDGIGQNWQIGRYADPSGLSAGRLGIVDYFGPPDYRSGTAAMLLDWGSLDPGFYARADVGNYLVRDAIAVPEPPSEALAVLALAVLGLVTRGRKGYGSNSGSP